MLNLLTFKSSVLFGTHTLLDKSLTVLQLPDYLYNLTANRYTNFVWLEALIMVANNTINVFLIKPDILQIIFNH